MFALQLAVQLKLRCVPYVACLVVCSWQAKSHVLGLSVRSTPGMVQAKLDTDLDVKVLTTGFWPSYPAPNMVLPQEMEKCVGAFQKFYGETTKNRKLNWMHSLVRSVLEIGNLCYCA